MTVIEHEVRAAHNATLTTRQRYPLSRQAYYALADAGLFGDAQIELIEGDIIEMAPIGPPHATINDPLTTLLKEAFGSGYTVRSQGPISIGTDAAASEPQPDVAVAIGFWRDYISRHPAASEVKLVVEVADSTLAYDRSIKSALYAAAGIPEYWIVNLVDKQVEVLRKPSEAGYSEKTIYRVGDTIEPLSTPGKFIALADFMP